MLETGPSVTYFIYFLDSLIIRAWDSTQTVLEDLNPGLKWFGKLFPWYSHLHLGLMCSWHHSHSGWFKDDTECYVFCDVFTQLKYFRKKCQTVRSCIFQDSYSLLKFGLLSSPIIMKGGCHQECHITVCISYSEFAVCYKSCSRKTHALSFDPSVFAIYLWWDSFER